MRAEDALFLYADGPLTPQQVGAVALLSAPLLGVEELRSGLSARLGEIPDLRRRLVPAEGQWRRPRWVLDTLVDLESRVREVTFAGSGCPSLEDLVARFFAAPLDPFATPWEMLLVCGLPDGPVAVGGGPRGREGAHRDALLVKIHHSLGDSFTLIGALGALLDHDRARPGKGGGSKVGRPGWPCSHPAQPRPQSGVELFRASSCRASRVLKSLAGMVCAGPTPWASSASRGRAPGPGQARAGGPGVTSPATTAPQGPGRQFVTLALQARAVTIVARRLGTNVPDLLLAMVAEATCRSGGMWLPAPSGRLGHLRVMVPHSVRSPQSAEKMPGPGPERASRPAANRTAGVLLDLPVFPMGFEDRVTAVRELHHQCLQRGDAEAAAFVLHAMNLLPAWLQRRGARAVYSGPWLGVIVSVFPGVRRECRLFGAKVDHVYPVLALADGTDVAIGAMTWGGTVSIGLFGTGRPGVDLSLLADEIERLFQECSSGGSTGSFVSAG